MEKLITFIGNKDQDQSFLQDLIDILSSQENVDGIDLQCTKVAPLGFTVLDPSRGYALRVSDSKEAHEMVLYLNKNYRVQTLDQHIAQIREDLRNPEYAEEQEKKFWSVAGTDLNPENLELIRRQLVLFTDEFMDSVRLSVRGNESDYKFHGYSGYFSNSEIKIINQYLNHQFSESIFTVSLDHEGEFIILKHSYSGLILPIQKNGKTIHFFFERIIAWMRVRGVRREEIINYNFSEGLEEEIRFFLKFIEK